MELPLPSTEFCEAPAIRAGAECRNRWRAFKQFALRGHVMDLAVGVVLGSAFGKEVFDTAGISNYKIG